MPNRLDGPADRKKDLNKKYDPKGSKGNAPISSYFNKQAKGNVKKAFNQGYKTT